MIGYRLIRLGTRKLRIHRVYYYEYNYYVEEVPQWDLIKEFDSYPDSIDGLKVVTTIGFGKYVKHLREIRE